MLYFFGHTELNDMAVQDLARDQPRRPQHLQSPWTTASRGIRKRDEVFVKFRWRSSAVPTWRAKVAYYAGGFLVGAVSFVTAFALFFGFGSRRCRLGPDRGSAPRPCWHCACGAGEAWRCLVSRAATRSGGAEIT